MLKTFYKHVPTPFMRSIVCFWGVWLFVREFFRLWFIPKAVYPQSIDDAIFAVDASLLLMVPVFIGAAWIFRFGFTDEFIQGRKSGS